MGCRCCRPLVVGERRLRSLSREEGRRRRSAGGASAPWSGLLVEREGEQESRVEQASKSGGGGEGEGVSRGRRDGCVGGCRQEAVVLARTEREAQASRVGAGGRYMDACQATGAGWAQAERSSLAGVSCPACMAGFNYSTQAEGKGREE